MPAHFAGCLWLPLNLQPCLHCCGIEPAVVPLWQLWHVVNVAAPTLSEQPDEPVRSHALVHCDSLRPCSKRIRQAWSQDSCWLQEPLLPWL